MTLHSCETHLTVHSCCVILTSDITGVYSQMSVSQKSAVRCQYHTTGVHSQMSVSHNRSAQSDVCITQQECTVRCLYHTTGVHSQMSVSHNRKRLSVSTSSPRVFTHGVTVSYSRYGRHNTASFYRSHVTGETRLLPYNVAHGCTLSPSLSLSLSLSLSSLSLSLSLCRPLSASVSLSLSVSPSV